ncbi:SDR family oxidoreductase [Kribbella albertanoniae]|uniref:NAD(P)-dependent oxidoreductase n=1 Tax=Kribbella albertanoniae TaxID=1266829 RepID=A0A4R4Q1W4_9ACTN|nr:NAD(P)-binding oxidoreductase [Kribbella albertanoniae]TDC28986.1 NAD(P)-dependent oxidoreductase [Kribbella albertanoniae]
MRITVFGATGGIGGHVVQQALQAGHEVTAVVRASSSYDVKGVEVVRVPGLTEAEPLIDAVDGRDAVISGVGPRTAKSGPVASGSTRSILAALTKTGVRRFVAVSAAPIGPTPPDESFLNRRLLLPMIRSIAADVYADLRLMEADITSSDTDWTIVRPPKLTNKALSGKYRTSVGGTVPAGYTIARADVAHLMLAAVSDPKMIDQAVGVAY